MQGVTSSDVSGKLGPALTSIVEVEGEPMEALLDTGSPVIIISLNLLNSFYMQLLAKQCQKDQNPNELKAKIKNLQESATICNYSGDRCAS